MKTRTHNRITTMTLAMTPLSKIDNTIDVIGNENEAGDEDENKDENESENEHEYLKEAPTKNDSADAERNDVTDPNTVSNTMDKKYGAQTQTNMRARKRKIDLHLKLHMQLKISSKRLKILHANVMLQTMSNTYLELRDYKRLHTNIQCGTKQHENVMQNPLITPILTQYHVSKGLKSLVILEYLPS